MSEEATAPLWRLELDDRLTITAADAGLRAVAGEAIVGGPLDALFSPRDRRGARQFHEQWSRADVRRVDLLIGLQLAGRELLARLLLVRSGDGWSAWVEDVTGDGNLVHELWATRERWMQIVKQSVEGVAVLDEGGRVLEFNGALLQMLDLRSARGVPLGEEAVRGAALAELLPGDDFAALRGWLAAGAGAGGRIQLEVQHRGRWLEVAARPLTLPPRRLAGACVLVRDATSRRHAEQLKLQMEAAEAASAAKSQFLAAMSHELRTPLNAILGYCEILLEDAHERGDTPLAADLTRIGHSATHLLDLVRNILDLGRIEAGRFELRPEELSIAALLEEVVGVLAPLAEKQGNRMLLRSPPDLGTMRADLMRLRQVLLNLVGNSVKFTRDGEITVGARRVVAPAGDRIELSVADTGIGIPPEKLSALFQEFSRVDPAGHDAEGAGLGLAVSRRLCRMMGGDIRVHSEPGRGSVFTVDLPAQCPSESEHSDRARETGT